MRWLTRWQGEFDRWWHRGERRGSREHKPTRDLTEAELAELSAELVRGAYTSYEQRQAAALARWLELRDDPPIGDLTTTRDLRLARLEAAATDVVDAVNRTTDREEWFVAIARLRAVLAEDEDRLTDRLRELEEELDLAVRERRAALEELGRGSAPKRES